MNSMALASRRSSQYPGSRVRTATHPHRIVLITRMPLPRCSIDSASTTVHPWGSSCRSLMIQSYSVFTVELLHCLDRFVVDERFAHERAAHEIIQGMVRDDVDNPHTAGLTDTTDPVLRLGIHGYGPIAVDEHDAGGTDQGKPGTGGSDGADEVIDFPLLELVDQTFYVLLANGGRHVERRSHFLHGPPVPREYHQGLKGGHLLKRGEGGPGLVPGERLSCL